MSEPLRNAIEAVVSRWHKGGLLRFNSHDDGSDDLLLRDELWHAALGVCSEYVAAGRTKARAAVLPDSDAPTPREATPLDEEGVIEEGSLTPGGNRVGPKAFRLIVSLSEYDDWMGAVLDVVDEAASTAAAGEGDGLRFDHDGTYRHHHDADTQEPVWWLNAEQFGGEKRPHRHHHRATSASVFGPLIETPPSAAAGEGAGK